MPTARINLSGARLPAAALTLAVVMPLSLAAEPAVVAAEACAVALTKSPARTTGGWSTSLASAARNFCGHHHAAVLADSPCPPALSILPVATAAEEPLVHPPLRRLAPAWTDLPPPAC